MPILSTPTFTGTEYINRPFSYVFSSDFSASPYQIQFTGSSPALLASTSGDTFFSTTGFAGTPGSAGTLSVSAVMTDPPFTVVDSSNYPVTVVSRIDVSDFAFGSNIQLYKYEPFGGNTYTANLPGDTLSFSRSSAVVLANLTSNDNVITFASTTGYQSASTSNLLIVDAISNSEIQDTVTRIVNIGAGRFTSPVSNSTITLYKNEPFTPIRFTAPLVISTPISSITLPTGLSFVQVDGSNYDLSGIPLLQQPFSNYQIIGRGIGTNSSKIITTTVSIGVNGERVLLDVSGSQDFSNLTTSTAITPSTVTARFPPYPYGGTLRYTWSPPLLPGFSFSTLSGNSNQSSNNFFPDMSDTSYSIVLSGEPNSNTISTLVSLNSNPYTVNLVGTRIAPAPVISNSKSFTFQFSPTILFDQISSPTLFTNVTIPSNSVYFGARTVLSSTPSPITGISIISGSLPSGLTLDFSSNTGRAYINGTPTSTFSPSFTLRASNTLFLTQDYTTSLSIIDDVVTFDSVVTPAVDTCYNFVQFRPVSNFFPGRYPANIQFKASALSGCNVTMTADALSGTGLTFTSNASNTYTITGTPTTVTPLTTLTVVATAQDSDATVSRNVKFSVSGDIITLNDASLNFIQNVPITPVQFSGSTLSERPITSYSSVTLPSGLSLSTGGLLTGTPAGSTSGTMSIIASTGYSSGTKNYSYSIIPDSVLLFRTPTDTLFPLSPRQPIPTIQVSGVSYSGGNVGNFRFSNLSPTYGFTIGNTSGIIGGTLTSNTPPDDILPPSVNFQAVGSSGLVDGSFGLTMTTIGGVVDRMMGLGTTFTYSDNGVNGFLNSNNNFSNPIKNSSGYDLRFINTSNTTLIVSGTGSNSDPFGISPFGPAEVARFSNLYDLSVSVVALEDISEQYVISSVVNKTGTTTWFASGGKWNYDSFNCNSAPELYLYKSSDDGLTWTSRISVVDESGNPLYKRGINGSVGSVDAAYYLAGSVLKYKDGVLLLGGRSVDSNLSGLFRSIDDGETWKRIASSFTPYTFGSSAYFEVGGFIGDINTEDSNVWIAFGYGGTSDTNDSNLQYSTDQGETWTNVTGQFDLNANFYVTDIQRGFERIGQIAYGSNTWLGSIGYLNSNGLRYSKDGSNWFRCDVSSLEDGVFPWQILSPPFFDGSNFNVFASSTSGSNLFGFLFSCSASSTDFSFNSWSSIPLTSFNRFTGPFYARPTKSLSSTNFSVNLTVDPFTTGPTFTGPSSTNYIFNQYVSIPPITLTATGTGTIYYFVNSNELPVGLRFDPLTAKITGTPARTGTSSVIVYAKDNVGVTSLTLTFTIIIPRIVKQQTSASAYTSMVRQYTLVNAAQNARGNRVLTEDGKQGEFMAPMGTDNLIPNNCFICDPNVTSNG